MKSSYFLLSIVLMCCEGTDEVLVAVEPENIEACNSAVIDSDLYYEVDNSAFLWAGEDTSTHFNITNWSLSACNLKQGLGREAFHALTDPDYELLKESTVNYPDTSKAVIVSHGNTVKVYPYQILRRHETVNEVVDKEPVMIVYCFLADLASVYTRSYCGKTLTFAVSGYTYKDPNAFGGKESFLLWDRNSESLWWPISDIAVAGVYQGEELIKFDQGSWGVAKFRDIRNRYPEALVLKFSQTQKELGAIRRTNGC